VSGDDFRPPKKVSVHGPVVANVQVRTKEGISIAGLKGELLHPFLALKASGFRRRGQQDDEGDARDEQLGMHFSPPLLCKVGTGMKAGRESRNHYEHGDGQLVAESLGRFVGLLELRLKGT
jgi:hypothetical protein